MLDDQQLRGVHVLAARMAALGSFPCVFQAGVIGRGGRPGRHHTRTDARLVHHEEHIVEAPVFLADEKAAGGPLFAVHQVGRYVAALPHLAVDARGGDVVVLQAVRAGQVLRYHEQAHPLGSLRAVLLPRQEEVDDILYPRVVSAADVDLLSVDEIATVRLCFVVRGDVAERTPRLGLGEGHGSLPFSGRHGGEIRFFQLLGSEFPDEVRRTGGEKAVGRQVAVCRLKDQAAGILHGEWHLLAAFLESPGSAQPTALAEGTHPFPYLRLNVYLSVTEVGFIAVHFAIGGIQVAVGQLFRGVQSKVDRLVVKARESFAGLKRGEIEHFVQYEA